MSRLVRGALVLVGATVVVLLAVGVIGIAWSDRANDVCREQAPASANGYSVNWEWSEAAYVCNYRAPNAETKRVGIIDAFHGEGRRRHRP
jgi:hypothetical protein